MYLEETKPQRGLAYSLMLILYFLSNSCGQDPAFQDTKFTSGQTGGADALGENVGDGSGDGLGEGENSNGNGFDPDNPNGGDPNGDQNENLPDDPDQAYELCAQLERKQVVKTLNYPERQDCSWGQGGNLERLNEFMQARESQSRSVSLPKDAVLCSFNIQSKTNQIHYDDFLYFTMDEYVLVGSNGHFVEMLEKSNDLHVWNWDSIKGKPWTQTQAYCVEGSTSCVVPPHDVPGALQVTMPELVTSKLAIKLLEQEQIDFSLIATGDNDNGDCFHTEVNLEVDMEYVVVAPD